MVLLYGYKPFSILFILPGTEILNIREMSCNAQFGIFPSIFTANPWEIVHIFFIESNREHNARITLKRKMLIILLCMTFLEGIVFAFLCPINLNIEFPLRISGLSLCFCNTTRISRVGILPVWLRSPLPHSRGPVVALETFPRLLLPLLLSREKGSCFWGTSVMKLLRFCWNYLWNCLSPALRLESQDDKEHLPYLFLHFQCLAIV